MRIILVLVALALVVLRPTQARAAVACAPAKGFAPAAGATVLPRAKLVYYSEDREPPKFTARIDGRKVPVKVTALPTGAAAHLVTVEIDSDRTGSLEIGADGVASARWKVSKKAEMPKEVPVAIGRFERNIPHSTVRENYLGLAIRLPKGTPATFATVKLRRDAQGPWTELVVPVLGRDFDDPRPVIRIGELGCTSNFSAPMLVAGVDIDVTLTLADGSTRPAKDLAPHLTLPAALPPQPKAPKPTRP